ncbi:MAG: FtsX-like permease family protein, partial [Candidatus Hydrogenedentota bacterium]
LNTVQMSIYERKREFGILMALGTKASYLMKIVFLETLFLMGIGMVIGLAFGGSLGFYFEKNPIVLSGEAAKGMMQMGFSPIIPAIVDFREMLIAILTLSIPAIVFVTFSIRKIAHFHPAEVIREA